MSKFMIRFNKSRGEKNRGTFDHVWRVFEDEKEYLCKNVDDYPLLDKSICESGCGCNGSDTLVPKKESSFYFAPPSY